MERTTISLPDELIRRLRVIAAEEGTSMSALVREAVERQVETRRPRPRSLGIGASGHPDTEAPLVALILDTGPLYASLDRSDRDHAACRKLIEAASEPLVIPAPVLVEVDYWIHERLHVGVLVALLDDIASGAYHVEHLGRDDHRRVRELVDLYSDADLGFVDASVLALVERLGEQKLATLDVRHFRAVRPRHTPSLRLLPVDA
jgi:predicted nucleic acid-binding protein/plasmid stability protein